MHKLLILCTFVLSNVFLVSGASAQEQVVQTEQHAPAYVLGAGDKLSITVFGIEELTGVFSITAGGQLPFPLIGAVQAAGKTVAQLQSDLAARLSPDYVLDPKISIDVLNYRPFFILGEVNKPGSYPFQDNLTVRQAVALAGGYTYRANQKKVFLRRQNEEKEQVYRLNGDAPVWVKPGDTIRVGERYF